MTTRQEPDEPTGYKWTCPLCGVTRGSLTGAEDDDAEVIYQRATAAFQTHVRASTKGGHGPKREYPDDFDLDTLGEHIEILRAGSREPTPP